MPVSLLVGQIQTTEFETNLRGDYYVQFDADYEISYRAVEPCSANAWRDVRWTVYRLGGGAAKGRVLWASNKPPLEYGYSYWTGFHGPPGKYELEWDIPAEAECLNSGHPRLEIYTDSDGYELVDGFLRFLALFFGAAGVLLVLRGLGGRLWGRFAKARTLRMLPELTLRNVLPVRKGNPAWPISPMKQLSMFSLMWGCVVSILVMLFQIFLGPQMSYGLLVRIHERGSTISNQSPWPKTMSVYAGSDGLYYVNGQPVKPEELRSKLRDELTKQMVWTVYLEADDKVRFAIAVDAIDTIQKAGAKVVWITPKIREELNRQTTIHHWRKLP